MQIVSQGCMNFVPLTLRQMLLDIAHSVSDGQFLSFIAFAKLVYAVLEEAVKPLDLLESAKAQTIYELWIDYAAGRRTASPPSQPSSE